MQRRSMLFVRSEETFTAAQGKRQKGSRCCAVTTPEPGRTMQCMAAGARNLVSKALPEEPRTTQHNEGSKAHPQAHTTIIELKALQTPKLLEMPALHCTLPPVRNPSCVPASSDFVVALHARLRFVETEPLIIREKVNATGAKLFRQLP